MLLTVQPDNTKKTTVPVNQITIVVAAEIVSVTVKPVTVVTKILVILVLVDTMDNQVLT